MNDAVERSTPRAAAFPPSFGDWRHHQITHGGLPIIAIAGSRGKTTVARMLESMFTDADLRSAIWTDTGVEFSGRRQRGELLPWSQALQNLGNHSLDVAVQELDWATVSAVGLPRSTYPIVVATNLCANSESCMANGEARIARRSLQTLFDAVRDDGALVLNGDDFAVAGQSADLHVPSILVSLNRDSPIVRSHLDRGGHAAWVAKNDLCLGTNDTSKTICPTAGVGVALGGIVGFELHNALTAAAVARLCGLPSTTIANALEKFTARPTTMPGSFNVVDLGGATVIVDRPAPSWFLRFILRAVSHIPHKRLLSVVGRLDQIDDHDLGEVGRLLGRPGGALIMHSSDSHPNRVPAFRHGVALNDVPPVIINTTGERAAMSRALKMLRPDDVLLVLADNPTSVLRTLKRAQENSSTRLNAQRAQSAA